MTFCGFFCCARCFVALFFILFWIESCRVVVWLHETMHVHSIHFSEVAFFQSPSFVCSFKFYFGLRSLLFMIAVDWLCIFEQERKKTSWKCTFRLLFKKWFFPFCSLASCPRFVHDFVNLMRIVYKLSYSNNRISRQRTFIKMVNIDVAIRRA